MVEADDTTAAAISIHVLRVVDDATPIETPLTPAISIHVLREEDDMAKQLMPFLK